MSGMPGRCWMPWFKDSRPPASSPNGPSGYISIFPSAWRCEQLDMEALLRIWIDADAAPRDVKELVFRSAKRLGIQTILVANQRLQPPPGNPMVTAVWVDGGPDVADQYIATHASAGDLVVTQDIPLAALLVPNQIAVLDPRGDEHTAETIGERLSVRDFMEQAR